MVVVAVWCSGCDLGSGPEVLSSSPTLAIFTVWFSICLPPAPPVHPAVIGDLAFAGVQIQGLFSNETAMVQVGLQVPTPLAVRKGLFSCEFLVRLQELCLHGSQCLLSAQASWLCQVHITASGCKRKYMLLLFLFVSGVLSNV